MSAIVTIDQRVEELERRVDILATRANDAAMLKRSHNVLEDVLKMVEQNSPMCFEGDGTVTSTNMIIKDAFIKQLKEYFK